MTGHDDLLLRALRREPLPRPPVWLMRQAGRYLPEYRKVRASAGGFLAMATNPELAAEVTLQPVRRFGVDAAILFSDILLPLAAMGMPLRFDEGKGPVLPEPLDSEARIDALRPIEPARDLSYVGDALAATIAGLPAGTTMLGFCGAPYTLACYAVEGGHSKTHFTIRKLMYREPALFARLMEMLADAVAAHLVYQIEQGAQAVVLFDTWAGTLTRDDYVAFARPFSERCLQAVAGRAPRLHFVLDGQHLLPDVVSLGTEGVAVDWRTDIVACLDRWGDATAFQGNLDPLAMLAPPDEVARRATALLDAVGDRAGHVMALGHGVVKETDPDAVAAFVEAVKSRETAHA